MDNKGRTVLIVDDEVNFLWSVARALRYNGYDVATAQTGEEALELLENRLFDVIITDIMLPGIDGFQLVEWLRKNRPNTAVVMNTAFGSMTIREKSQKAGALYYLEKPIDLQTLITLLAQVLDTSGFAGKVSDIDLLDYLQLIATTHKTKLVRVSNRREMGLLVFEKGQITHAECKSLSGIDAFYYILSWQGGSFADVPIDKDFAVTINQNTMFLLMEAARVRDERLFLISQKNKDAHTDNKESSDSHSDKERIKDISNSTSGNHDKESSDSHSDKERIKDISNSTSGNHDKEYDNDIIKTAGLEKESSHTTNDANYSNETLEDLASKTNDFVENIDSIKKSDENTDNVNEGSAQLDSKEENGTKEITDENNKIDANNVNKSNSSNQYSYISGIGQFRSFIEVLIYQIENLYAVILCSKTGLTLGKASTIKEGEQIRYELQSEAFEIVKTAILRGKISTASIRMKNNDILIIRPIDYYIVGILGTPDIDIDFVDISIQNLNGALTV